MAGALACARTGWRPPGCHAPAGAGRLPACRVPGPWPPARRAAHAGPTVRICRSCGAGPMCPTRALGWSSACLPLPASAERASFRDTTR